MVEFNQVDRSQNLAEYDPNRNFGAFGRVGCNQNLVEYGGVNIG